MGLKEYLLKDIPLSVIRQSLACNIDLLKA